MGNERLPAKFFQRDADKVAPDLLGALLVRRLRGREMRVRLVEIEAYVGPHDLACHASKGCTPRTHVMFRPGGIWYVYFIYGMHEMLNIVTGTGGDEGGQAVLIRGAQALEGIDIAADLSGPGKLTRALSITRAFNGKSVEGDALWLERGETLEGVSTRRIGVDYAKEWAEAPLRFVAKGLQKRGRR